MIYIEDCFEQILHFRCSRPHSPPFSTWSPSHSSPSSWWPTSRVTSVACGQSHLLFNSLLRNIKRSSQILSLFEDENQKTMPNSSLTQISLLLLLLLTYEQLYTHQLMMFKRISQKNGEMTSSSLDHNPLNQLTSF